MKYQQTQNNKNGIDETSTSKVTESFHKLRYWFSVEKWCPQCKE